MSAQVGKTLQSISDQARPLVGKPDSALDPSSISKFSLQKKLLDICLDNDFLEMTPEAQALKAKVNNRDSIRTGTLPDTVLLVSSLLFFFF